MTKQTVISSHIIQMYILLRGARDSFVCLTARKQAMMMLTNVSAHTVDAMIMSDLVMASLW